jgi:4-amino-4-deoxy-L-arabinose transferase-like glycosyltransferase
MSRWRLVRDRAVLTRVSAVAALAVITVFGALLRLDALTVKYGWLEHPAWAVRAERALQPLSERLRPSAVPWARVDRPYEGGDPINYLRFAREMRHFYQAHVREPVFLASTRGMLWLMRGSDIAVSYASALAGTLAIVATYLLGAAAWSRTAGLVAAAALAIELTAVTWSVDGWRDDTFMFFVALCGWTFVRLLERRTPGWAAAAGLAAAGACLTRISALSFVVPALLWIGVREWRRRASLRPALVAAVVTAVLVAPFLINCWRATGDPFFAINYHTRYYRAAEGLAPDHSVGALEYVGRKLGQRPFATVDTAAVGLLVFPFTNKWTGFDAWLPRLGRVLLGFAFAGLVLALWYPAGRLLWLVLVTSLVPYAVTWPLGGGGEWRFTQHAYPIYLVAAGSAIAALGSAIRGALSANDESRAWVRLVRLRPAIACGAALAAGWLLYVTLPYLVVREALAAGETVSIAVSDRDLTFFPRANWSDRAGSGNVIVRVAVADRVSIRLPLPLPVEHLLTLRMDAPALADPAYQPRVSVFVDQRPIGTIRFENNPDRVGAYRFQVPQDLAGRSLSRLDLVASHTVRADQSGPRFAWLPGETPVAFYLWYVRVEPRQVSRAPGT